jgi:hypothetical protein
MPELKTSDLPPCAGTGRDRNGDIATIVRLMPSFARVFGDTRTLRDYSRGVPVSRPGQVHLLRQKALAAILADRARTIVGNSAEIRLPSLEAGEGLACNIVDHQKMMSNPVQLSVSIVAHLESILGTSRGADIVGFSTAAVGLEEPFNRRSVHFAGRRINLYPARRRNDVVHWAPRQSIDLVARAMETGVWRKFTADQQAFLFDIGEAVRTLDYDGCTGLSDQLTRVNHFLWPRLFAEEMRGSLPGLLQLDFEDIGARYLVHLMHSDPGAFPVRMLVDPGLRQTVLEAFDGLVGAWDSRQGTGSHFFWANRNGHRVPLQVAGSWIERPDTGERTPLEAEAIVERLASRDWMPGQILMFAALIFYAGAKPIMGWSLEFVTRLGAALRAIVEPVDPDEAERIGTIAIDNMNLFSILKREAGDPSSPDLSALDIIAAGGLSRRQLESAGELPLARYLDAILEPTLEYAIDKYRAEPAAARPPDA